MILKSLYIFPHLRQAACMTFDVDIICIAVAEKQPFHFKRAPVNGVSYSILYPYLTAHKVIFSGTAAFIELGNKISKITVVNMRS